MADQKPDDEKVVRPFADVVRMFGDGRLHDELSQAVHDMIEAVMLQGKPGTIGITLKFDVDNKMATPMLVTSDAVVVKAPKTARPKSMFFVDKTGNPSREHPNMQPLFDEGLKVVPQTGDDKPIKVAVEK